jgi:hypothetical protein
MDKVGQIISMGRGESYMKDNYRDVIIERGFVQADDVYYDKRSYYADSNGYDIRDYDQNAYNYPIDETDCWK